MVSQKFFLKAASFIIRHPLKMRYPSPMPSQPKKLNGPFRVYIGLVPSGYLDPAGISQTIQEGINFCGLTGKLSGKVVIRPDLADVPLPQRNYASVHNSFLKAALPVLSSTNKNIAQLLVLGRNHTAVKNGEQALSDNPQVSIESIDSNPLIEYLLSKDRALNYQERNIADNRLSPAPFRYWNRIATSPHFADADSIVYMPKLKSSVLTDGFSGALRLGGEGNLTSDQALTGQNLHNDRRINDMLEVANPDLIISDGIIAAYGGNELTQAGHELGVILVANNPVAHDIIAAQIFNKDPLSINHLRIAMERGWGPQNSKKIALGGAGEEGIALLREKTAHWDSGFIRLEQFAEKYAQENGGLSFPWEIISGTPYEAAGTHGMLLSWLYSAYDNRAKRLSMTRWPKASIVLGETSRLPQHGLVLLLGDRAIASFKKQTTEAHLLISQGSRSLWKVRLRNSRTHIVAMQEGSPPTLQDLNLFFFMASLGRVKTNLLRWSIFKKSKPKNKRSSPRLVAKVKTSDFKRNLWWAQGD